MARFKPPILALALVGICTFAATVLAKPTASPKCGLNGNYSFFFWDPDSNMSGVGYFGVSMNSTTQCRSGIVLPGGIINCNFDGGTLFEDFIEDGSVFLESDGEGTMEIETNSSAGICGTGDNALELDISVVLAGKTVLFNSNGVEFAGSGTIPQAGYDYTFTGRADKCFAGSIAGCYDFRFWSGPAITALDDSDSDSKVGDCTICLDNRGHVTSGDCRCSVSGTAGSFEYLSEVETGGYTLGEECQSSTGYLWFETSSDEICGEENALALDFAVAQGGSEIIGACDPAEFILNNSALANAGFDFNCSFEGYLE